MARPGDQIRRYLPVTAAIDTLRRKELALLDPSKWDDRNDSRFMRLYKAKKNIPALYAMCATQRSHVYHHWRVFTPAAEGVCLDILRAPLEDSLKGKQQFRYGAVEYLSVPQVEELIPRDIDRLPFCKRIAFDIEEEYRVVAVSQEPQTQLFPLAIDLAWINRIELNPWMPLPIVESMTEVIQCIPGCSSIEISQSSILDHESWVNACDRLIDETMADHSLD